MHQTWEGMADSEGVCKCYSIGLRKRPKYDQQILLPYSIYQTATRLLSILLKDKDAILERWADNFDNVLNRQPATNVNAINSLSIRNTIFHFDKLVSDLDIHADTPEIVRIRNLFIRHLIMLSMEI